MDIDLFTVIYVWDVGCVSYFSVVIVSIQQRTSIGGLRLDYFGWRRFDDEQGSEGK